MFGEQRGCLRKISIKCWAALQGILECQEDEEAGSLERWAELYVSYKEALLAQRSVEATRDFVVWDIPLQAAKAGERLESPGTLRTPDGRKFKISISSANITGKGDVLVLPLKA